MASINLQGDTSGSISISAPSVAGSNTLTLPASTQTLATQNSLGVRNIIINGDMRIAQRGTSASSLTGAGYHTVDRFHMQISSLGTWTQTQDTDVPSGQGFANSLKLDCTTADASPSSTDVLNMNYRLEGQMLQHLKKGTSSAESVTISFWVKSNKTGTYTLEIVDGDNTRQVSKAYTIDVADTWEKKTITFDGDTTGTLDNDNNTSLTVAFWLATGSDKNSGTFSNGTWASLVNANRVSSSQVNLADSTSNYINITGVQLEVGTEATPFEHRPYDMELARCHRYCYQQTVTIDSENIMPIAIYDPSNAYTAYRFPVVMRTAPTFSTSSGTVFRLTYSGTNVNITGGMTGGSASQYSIQMRAISSGLTTGVAAWIRGVSGTTGQYIRFDAEL